jgi:hypothetical protein
MKNRVRLTCLVALIFCWLGYTVVSADMTSPITPTLSLPKPTPTPAPLNTIMIGQCQSSEKLNKLIEAERARGLVIDARPFVVNQSTGKTSFNGSAGRVSVVNTNPFIYKYKISVAQQEFVSTALTDFVKLLLPESLTKVVGPQSGSADRTAAAVIPPSKLSLIASRLEAMQPEKCKNPVTSEPAPCLAVGAMYETYQKIHSSGILPLSADSVMSLKDKTENIEPTKILKDANTVSLNTEFDQFTNDINKLRDEEADAYTICEAATALNKKLNQFKFEKYFEAINKAKKVISVISTQAKDLEDMVKAFNEEEELKKSGVIPKCKGFNCVGQFDAYAKEARAILGSYETELNRLRNNAQEMRDMYLLTEQMKGKEGLFTRTFMVAKKFELSQATISVSRERLPEKGKSGSAPINQSGQVNNQSRTDDVNVSDNLASPRPTVVGGESSEGTAPISSSARNFQSLGNQSGTPAASPTTASKEPEKGKENKPAAGGDVSEVIQLGRPRFMISAGLVYSPLPRRTYQSVKGFVVDAQGNLTGDGSASVVGFGENSSRRLLPMVLLNSRLLSYEPASLFFTFGVTAKYDDNVDIEYLFGPSVSLLNDRALFTVGLYGGKTQNLLGGLRVGQELPEALGDAKLFRKNYTWKPGFSFSYAFSRATKKGAPVVTSSSSPTDDLKNEIRIGGIPFNLAVGLAYTSLEQRTYDEIVGFANDRQGNLTNGQNLARVVGLTSDSDYRLTPIALLHSRLTRFGGGYDLYFSTGITGKKTDNSFDVEYLLGASVNIYQRRVFLTFGTFAGKQQILGGDFFEGMQLGKTQNVTIQNRYVWKPAISFSYDITRIIPGTK